MGGGDKTIPAPDVAFGRDQPLAGLELRDQLRTALARHHADLRQAAGELSRRLHVVGERHDALVYKLRSGQIVRADYYNDRQQALKAVGLEE